MFPERAQVRFKFLYKNLMLTGFFFFWSGLKNLKSDNEK